MTTLRADYWSFLEKVLRMSVLLGKLMKTATISRILFATSAAMLLINPLVVCVDAQAETSSLVGGQLSADTSNAVPVSGTAINSDSEALSSSGLRPPMLETSAIEATGAQTTLKGLVAVYDGPSPNVQVSNLLKIALDKNSKRDHIVKKDKEYHGAGRRTLAVVKAVAHYATEYRGFEMSSEGADVILDEKLKLKSQASIAYAEQKQVDEMHWKISQCMFQLAQALGVTDAAEQQRTLDTGMNQLKQLVGDEEAQNALKDLKAWSAQVHVPESVFKQPSWSVMDVQAKTENLLKDSAQSDPVIALVRRALHKYNGHSKLALASAKMINTTLAIAMFSPTVVSPAAQIFQFVYQMATGGPEDSKLLAELYLDKRLESRFNRLKQESNQAVNAYNNALLTKNPILLGYSESMISSMSTEETGAKIIGAQKLVARHSTHNDEIDCIQTHGTSM
jgi:hypothetical protein